MKNTLLLGVFFLTTTILMQMFLPIDDASALEQLSIEQSHDIITNCNNESGERECIQYNRNTAITEDLNPFDNNEKIKMRSHSLSHLEENGDKNDQRKEQEVSCSGEVICKNLSDTMTIIRE